MPEREEPETPVVVAQAYDLTLWLLPKVEKLPRSYRFTLGLRMTDAALDLLGLLVKASYEKNKTATLLSASHKVNLLRHLIRLSKAQRARLRTAKEERNSPALSAGRLIPCPFCARYREACGTFPTKATFM